MKGIFLFFCMISFAASSAQNIGVGTEFPTEKLDVRGNLRAGNVTPAAVIGIHPSYASTYLCFWKDGFDFSLGTEGTNTYLNAPSATGSVNFNTGNVNRMTILGTNGNVGIGINPTQRLDVYGNVRSGFNTGALMGTHPSYSNSYACWWRDGYDYTLSSNGISTYLNAPSGSMYFGTNGFNRMYIDLSGNVGIGTTTPSQRLHVVGNICATGAIGACSDMRYKTRVVPVGNRLSSLLNLEAIYYDWKPELQEEGFSKDRQMGFSAQQVEQYFPEIVQTDSRGYKSVDYGRLTPLIVEGMKAQQQELETMRVHADRQEARIAKLEKQLERLMKSAD